jgi:hypothetical protein
MHSTSHLARIDAAFDQLEAELHRCSELSLESSTAPELLALLERYELLRAKAATLRYQLTNPFARSPARNGAA